jgi:hypothetical protein
MLRQINGYFKIEPDIDLDLMQHNQSLPALSSVVMEEVTQVISKHRPNVVVVQVGSWLFSNASFVIFTYPKQCRNTTVLEPLYCPKTKVVVRRATLRPHL